MKLLSIEYIPGVEFEALGIVKGTVVQTKNVGKDFMAGMKTLVGGEITGYTEMLNEARQIATKRMVDEAKEMNADAVIGVKYGSSQVMSGAAEVIDGLPHRLQTQLQKGWNGGTELSQGQWQKIAIARCLFKQSDVYLFDEPFSALDAISEQHIIKRLNLKTKMSITIFITHRYSSLRLADFILVLKDGELVESGSHQELQKAGKYYSELIKAQIEPIDHLAQLDET